MASTSALPQTLRSITATKIKELSKQRGLFEKRRDEIIQSAAATSDLRTKARVLLEGVTRLKGHPNDAFDKEDLDVDAESFETPVEAGTERAVHANIRRFLLQGKYDPSVSESSLRECIESLEKEIMYMERAHDHASFYSALVTEWLEDLEASGGISAMKGEEDESVEDVGMEKLGRTEMHEQRRIWEHIVFNGSNVQADMIRAYLDSLFMQTALSQQALKELRETIKSFATSFSAEKTWITLDELSWVSQSLLKTDLLSKEKTVILKELMRNNAVAQEVADVLNMRIASLDSWSWPGEGVPVEMRRQLNGKYRVFMDEDLLDSLMFQYLGSKWAVALRSAFVTFLGSRGWKKSRDNIPEQDNLRRSYFVGLPRFQGVNEERQGVYKRDYFMSQLPSTVDTEVGSYDNDDDDDGNNVNRPQNALDTKHSLLHLLITESILHTNLHGQFTAIRSDFKWFGPSLPHTTMLTVLSYFGVPQQWLEFFRTFLEAPMKFVHDGPNATVLRRKRGIPMSHTLSTAMGEAVLFCMDYAVNQSTDGAYLYRLHDDFWFWGQERTCVKAWTAMTVFAEVMGLEFNEEKTGTVRWQGAGEKLPQILTPPPVQPEGEDLLPSGNIRWGFLKLDSQERRFIIDREMVEKHIAELRRQLSACRSIFAWIQAWNGYFGRFFVNNFAKPAVCFGREHIDMAITTLSYIEHALFPGSDGGGVTNSLRKTIAERFDVHDIPDGLFYFPIELGGLNLLNPYIPLLAMREDIKQTPHRRIQKAFLDEEAAYLSAKENFEKTGPQNPQAFVLGSKSESAFPREFLSLEEYMKYAECFSRPLLDAYRDLIRIPDQISVDLTLAMRGILTLSATRTSAKTISGDWRSMSPYWKWTAELYRAGMVKRYGNLAAVNREFMPVGVVETLKEGKFRWQG
ncbi:hypothetical protein AN0661.2 [Aspergillus nidulans FGSC A4]|uniref:Reverse transcriptase domain-containing protein n=1 Tax=Emericella nidulans (strain FGSC A4 / ATCC 38163 / CBS 112.46 / NRRL 194 / M139) TaxID=227321 RepID=Q5BFL9_EMENI|nr:hypothetical protein [Aspergillus nidulans FGSC A4]EAA65437.1 hypothetical protein AN0661.2 [Aspergillus nidulans FGSC A4]CBF89036.1 TPA: conserved hypothetical protein [Aspergillus nidulans FGSC A4]|eukprot:XP_658265.1 hypothetical protein AN0661.2 [Aspergillus nidulans FGSC A4]